MKRLHWIVVSFVSLISLPSFAYNFLYIHPTTGEPIRWDNTQTIKYYLDPKPPGLLTNEQTQALLEEAMKIWENASLNANAPRFEFAGYLPEDVNGTNYQKYVSLGQCYTDDLDSCASEAQKNLQTVIVFDEDGSILSNELCRITACVASAGAKVFSGSAQNTGNIVQGIAVFGVGAMDTRIIVHEIGHLLGLAHSYVNLQMGDERYLPIMMSPNPTLNPDDIAGISVLYPSDSFETETATIKGQILKSDGTPMIHVNVIARNVDDPLCEVYSYLSGRFCEYATSSLCETGGTAGYDDSSYTISSLPPGSYTLEVEEVADDGLAITIAPGLIDPFIYGDAEFWNDGDAVSEDHLTSSVITLAAGETRENVDIILNRSEVTDDRIKFIPLDTFTPGPGTRCPEDDSGDASGTTDTIDSESAGGCSLIL